MGSWAPGELDKMLLEGKIIRLPVETYNRWFEKLPVKFQQNVMKQWGRPEESGMMIKNGEFVIPALMMGNAVFTGSVQIKYRLPPRGSWGKRQPGK